MYNVKKRPSENWTGTPLPEMRRKLQIIYSEHEIYISLNCKIIEMSRTALTPTRVACTRIFWGNV